MSGLRPVVWTPDSGALLAKSTVSKPQSFESRPDSARVSHVVLANARWCPSNRALLDHHAHVISAFKTGVSADLTPAVERCASAPKDSPNSLSEFDVVG